MVRGWRALVPPACFSRSVPGPPDRQCAYKDPTRSLSLGSARGLPRPVLGPQARPCARSEAPVPPYPCARSCPCWLGRESAPVGSEGLRGPGPWKYRDVPRSTVSRLGAPSCHVTPPRSAPAASLSRRRPVRRVAGLLPRSILASARCHHGRCVQRLGRPSACPR